MTTRVALLRAVNLGKRQVPMARLRAITEGLSHTEVWTHVNSGNVVFDAAGRREALERGFEKALEDEFGFEVTTFVRTLTEIEKTLDATPFDVAAGDTHFVTFLKDVPTTAQARQLEAASTDFDTLVVTGRDVHWLMHGKSIDTKVPTRVWEAAIGKHRSTSRNTTMLRGLLTKARSRVS